MIEISFVTGSLAVLFGWLLYRGCAYYRCKPVDWKYEAKLLTVYICLVVIARFVYFPLHQEEGRVASLFLDIDRMFPLWINLVPIVHMFEVYDGWLINIIGNITMFIPVGLIWPCCFKKLDTIGKVVLAGGGFTLFIEITQLPFYARCSDIDDLIMNSTGVFIGAIIYFGVKHLKNSKKI